MAENGNFPRVAERLRIKAPKSKAESLHEFATDLAVGYDEGAWDTLIFFGRYADNNVNWSISGSHDNPEIYKALKSKWSENKPPDFRAMHSSGYFNTVIGRDDAYTLSEKTLQLTNVPVAVSDVFISYKRDRSSEFALLLESRIKHETKSAKPFLDKNLKPGDVWHAKLEARISDCAAFICLLAPGTLGSKYVRKEIYWALAEYEKRNRLIIPVWHKRYDPDNEKYPDEISGPFQAVRVLEESAKGYDSAVDEALNRLGYSTAFLEQRRAEAVARV